MIRYPEEDFNLVQIFLDRVKRYGNRPALYDRPSGRYTPWSWNEWALEVKRTALGLRHLGVKKGDRVAILSENRPHWTFADLGILSLGAVTVPIYPTSSAREICYILEHAATRCIFVSSQLQFEKIRAFLDSSPLIQKVILFDPGKEPHEKTISFSKLVEKGGLEELNNSDLYLQMVRAVKPEDLATLIYTSGTTGPPKGVMLTHHNFVANALGSREKIHVTEKDIALSFLPLSHVFERLAGYYFMLFYGATIHYAESMQTVPEDLVRVRPTVAASVPRLYEKMYARILETVESASPIRRSLFAWAVKTGRQRSRARMAGEALGPALAFKFFLAKKLVFTKLKNRLGGRIRFFISGGAPLAKELAEFFYAADVLILEGYGLTETSPVMAVNSTKKFRFGTVGQILSNVEVKIAEDGEILTRGPCIMKGYYQNESATREAMEGEWFHTGDIGLLDPDGFLKITDRKKDIIVTSGGKNISPQNIESLVLGDKLFSQIVVVGDKKNYLVALVVPNRNEVEHYAQTHGLDRITWREILCRQEIYDWIKSRLDERTKDLAHFEQIKYMTLLSEELTLANGELTPTLKIKRKVVMQKYQLLIEGLYRNREPQIRHDRPSES
ncbi:MAG: long-chain fatty acid--CoA ligase [Candidatus Omnitrophica bacterium]|nr:long-chain fatty acid--CoA ligase [Candidatus Omnitrophota bacterium]